jgi:hypothetical protein
MCVEMARAYTTGKASTTVSRSFPDRLRYYRATCCFLYHIIVNVRTRFPQLREGEFVPRPDA